MRAHPAEALDPSLAVTDDAVLGGRLRLLQPVRGHRAGHDAILLAAAAPRSGHAVDLGAGIGTAGLALLMHRAVRSATLVEIEPDLVRLAFVNADRNGFSTRVNVVRADVAKVARRGGPPDPAPSGADLVVANPPFNDPSDRRPSPDSARRHAHSAPETDLEHWVAAAKRSLRSNGRFVMIHRPDALGRILATMEGAFGAIEIIPIHARARGPAIRIIVRAVKGKRTPPVIRPGFVLAGEDGRPTHEAEAVLRGAAALDAT